MQAIYENAGYTLKVKKGSGIVVKIEEDLGGLKIGLSPGVAVANGVEKYNETHPDNKIDSCLGCRYCRAAAG